MRSRDQDGDGRLRRIRDSLGHPRVENAPPRRDQSRTIFEQWGGERPAVEESRKEGVFDQWTRGLAAGPFEPLNELRVQISRLLDLISGCDRARSLTAAAQIQTQLAAAHELAVARRRPDVLRALAELRETADAAICELGDRGLAQVEVPLAARADRLPHLDAIQSSFGRHDVRSVESQVGGEAVAATAKLGARAFAAGDRVVFRDAPDLHTAAHEAAHVVQQRAGAVTAERDTPGDELERHADLVADRVVRGEPVEALLDQMRGGGSRTGAIQRKLAPADETPIPAGQPFIVDPTALKMTARRTWLEESPEFVATRRAPEKLLEMLHELQRRGGISWAKKEALEELARFQLPASTSPTIVYYLAGPSFRTIGLPPTSSAMVARHGDGLEVIVRVDGIPAGTSLPLSSGDVMRVLDAVEVFTGLSIEPAMRAHRFSATADRGAGVAVIELPAAAMRNLVGAAAWRAWAERGGPTAGAAPMSVAHDLMDAERVRVIAWLDENVAPGTQRGEPTRALLALIDEIDSHPHSRGAVLAYLQAHRAHERVDEFALRGAIDAANYAQERKDLDLKTVDGANQDPVTLQTLPARINQHSGLVLDGASMSLAVELDWEQILLTPRAEWAFAQRPWRAEVEWVFMRADRPGVRRVEQTSHPHDITTTTRFQLEPREERATWTVHAFVRTTHFAPVHLTTLIEVKSQAARMVDLRDAALGGAPLVEQDGRFTGPALSTRTPKERAAARQQEIELYDRAADYLEGQHNPLNDDAVRVLHHQNAVRREQDRALASDQADGWRTFDVRATYLSKTDSIPSGPLDLYGAVRRDRVLGIDMVHVRLRDLSRRFEQEVYTFEAHGLSFEAALHDAFVTLAKDYPVGRVALFAEEQDSAGARATGRTVGYEQATYSTWRAIKDHVFHPLVQLAIAATSAAVMIFAPPLGAIALGVNIASATVQSVDDLVTRADNGTLSLGRVTMDMGGIALAVLPAVSSLPVVRASGRAMFMLQLADKTGQVLMIGIQARETLAAMQANDVAAIAAMYGEMIALQKSTHASDPRLPKLQAEIEARAAGVRSRLAAAFSQTVGQQLIFMAPGAVFERMQAGRGIHAPHGAGESEPRELVVDEHGIPVGDAPPLYARDPQPEPHATRTSNAAIPLHEARPRDPVEHLGLQLANVVGQAHYEEGGRFHVATDRGVVLVEIRRTSGAARVVREEHSIVVLIPNGLSEIELSRVVVAKLTEIRHQELRIQRGEKADAVSDLGDKGTGQHLSPADMGAIAELRLLRIRERDLVGRPEVEAVHGQIEVLERRLGLHGDVGDAERRRHAVEVQVAVQDDAARRSHVARELEGTQGHPGIEVHNHLFGIVEAEVYRKRAEIASSGLDTGSWVPLLKYIAHLEGAAFDHGKGPNNEIAKRAMAGDAVAIARGAEKQVDALILRAKNAIAADQAAFVRGAEIVAREAAETALKATTETDYNSSYEIRDELIKMTFGSVADRKASPDVRRQAAYDDYLREAILKLAHDGVGYSEQSASVKKASTVASPERIRAAIQQLIAEGKLVPGQVDIQLLTMTVTYHFGQRNPALPAMNTPVRDPASLARDVETTQRQMGGPGTVGLDIASLEVYDWDPEGGAALADITHRLLDQARRTGSPSILRPHLGEGVVDNLQGHAFNADHQRIVQNGELTHYARSRNNIEVALKALEGLPPGTLDPSLLIVRFGHVTHATPDQAARMKALGVIAEVNLGSNVASGSVSQTDGVHGNRVAGERFDDHSFATLLYYDTQIILSTDAGAVMSTTLREEYRRAKQVIEEVLSGARTVRVGNAAAAGRGADVAGDATQRALGINEMTAGEIERFLRGYEKLFTDAQRYYMRRPKPRAVAGNPHGDASPMGGAHHVDLAVSAGLIPSKGTRIYEGVRADVEVASGRYRAAGYQVTHTELAGSRLLVTVSSADGEFSTALESWAGDGPSYLPVNDRGVLDRPMTNWEVRAWYKEQLARIVTLNESWVSGDVPLVERARRAFEIRHHARLAAREKMASSGDVVTLNVRDIELYGEPDGPSSFEAFVAEQLGRADEPTGVAESDRAKLALEAVYESIIDSSRRSNKRYDLKYGSKDTNQ